MGGCKPESAESRRDSIAAGALKLGGIASGEERAREHGGSVPDEMARASVRFAQETIALVKRLIEEHAEPRQTEAFAAARRGEATRARWSAEASLAGEDVKVGDTFRRVAGVYTGGVIEATAIDGTSITVAGPGRQTWVMERSVLLDDTLWQRVRAVEVSPPAYEPGVEGERLATDAELAVPAAPRGEIGDRFKRLEGRHAGLVYTVEEIRGNGTRLLASDYGHGRDVCHIPLGDLYDSAVWQEMSREPSDLDGPAGDELPFAEQREDRRAQAHAASVREADRQALADMTEQRDVWEESCTAAARELRAAGSEAAEIVAAWEALGIEVMPGSPAARVGAAIEALSRRVVVW